MNDSPPTPHNHAYPHMSFPFTLIDIASSAVFSLHTAPATNRWDTGVVMRAMSKQRLTPVDQQETMVESRLERKDSGTVLS